MTTVAVVGGGIAGLAAGWELSARADVEVTVLEASDRLGGKVRTGSLAGMALDLGPDCFLARRPEAVQLCSELGLADMLVAPAATSASLWSRGRLRPLPTGQVLGIPTDPVALARSGVVSPLGVVRAAIEPWLPGRPLDGDEAVGALARRRLGHEVTTRLVDPLLGGINAGDVDHLSVEAGAPQIAAAARRSRSLVRALRAGPAPSTAAGPVFLTLPGGLGRLVEVLAAGLAERGVVVRTSCPVESIERAPDGGYRLAIPGGEVAADGVVLALPAQPAGSLLTGRSPAAADALAGVASADVALVALAYRTGDAPLALVGSGFLVPRPEGRLMTACSWSSAKWAHLGADGVVRLRLSAGRAGDPRAWAMDDSELVERLRVELRAAVGISAEPAEVVVTRWPAGFPQYRPGHLERMAAAAAGLAADLPDVALAGAALGGIGIPACIGSGRTAAHHVLATVR